MFDIKYIQFGFIQGDGNLGGLKSPSHKGLVINIGRDDDDILPLFNLTREDVPGREYYWVGYNDELRELGFSDETLPNRKLPKTFQHWSDNQKLSFFRGLFSANGSALEGYGRISFKSTCRGLIDEMKNELIKFNIKSNIGTNRSKKVMFPNGEYICRESYDLVIGRRDSVLNFMDKIGFVHAYKNEKIYKYFNNEASNKTSVMGVRHSVSGKYNAKFKMNGSSTSKVFDNFDDAVKFRLVKETEKKNPEKSQYYNPEANTLQLTYLSHDDNLQTHIECTLQGEIIKFTKPA